MASIAFSFLDITVSIDGGVMILSRPLKAEDGKRSFMRLRARARQKHCVPVALVPSKLCSSQGRTARLVIGEQGLDTVRSSETAFSKAG